MLASQQRCFIRKERDNRQEEERHKESEKEDNNV